ncbi:hypothetical protein HN51_052504 [Arachis hypogaea]|uniref:Uncharacterized protein n=1 Tax=Arachis hypogaea TaxID=3818 RepID=A0A445CAE4_ARAHY|nr:uncharacterized protein LOC107605974 [Arachis ipaensis]XP_025666958.1 uncharacterized protein LOC112765257 [Arachis hypogaea]RYR47915.1 hypothetical protein Ahy_A07g033900 isoform A [Arachis hypogaea]
MNKQNANNDGVLDDQSSNVGAPPISLVTPPPPLQLQRMSSIESEPKTLFHGELNIAREAAIEVLNSHPREQALKIFLAGLQPVEIAKDATEDNIGSDLDDEE